MHFTTLILAGLACVASAQKVHVVTVASKNNSLIYSPDKVTAAKGDSVQFQFVAGNHTVTQSTFDEPCAPISMVQKNVTGFHSGFMAVAASAASGMLPTYTVMLNDTKPLWLYCAQGKHCQAGMVMVINENTAANASRSLASFKKLASTAKANIAPGGSSTSTTPSVTPSTGGGGNGTGTGTGTGTGSGTGTGTGTSPSNGSATAGSPQSTSPTKATPAGSNMVKVGSSLALAAVAAAFLLM